MLLVADFSGHWPRPLMPHFPVASVLNTANTTVTNYPPADCRFMAKDARVKISRFWEFAKPGKPAGFMLRKTSVFLHPHLHPGGVFLALRPGTWRDAAGCVNGYRTQ
jgi:hypothetical protein